MAKLFIAYRRTDSATFSGRIYDRLVSRFGKKNVFKDVDDIPIGVNFARYIEQSLAECMVALVVIGRSWTTVRGAEGTRRLDDPDDFVRLEVENALQLGLTVIPVLVDGASMPSRAELPPSLQPLALINSTIVRNDPDFSHDMERLIARLERLMAPRGPLGLLTRRANRPAPASVPIAKAPSAVPPVPQPSAAVPAEPTAAQAPMAVQERAPDQERVTHVANVPPMTHPDARSLDMQSPRGLKQSGWRSRRTNVLAGVATLLIIASLGVLFASRGLPHGGSPNAAATHTPTPKFGGSLVDGILDEPSSLMPGQSAQTFADLVDASIWASLIYTTSDVTLAPGLLTEVPSVANNDIKVANDSSGSPATESIMLKLRSGLKFSDGSPLTSLDIAFTIKTLSDPTYGDKQGFPASEIASVSTPDAQTTVVNLNTIDVAFLTNAFADPLLFSPLPKAHYGSMTPAAIAKDFQPAVTTGPFTVTELVKGDHITVSRNPNYYQAPKPYLDKVTFKLFPDANTEVTALQAGQIDTAYFLPVTAVDTLKNIPGYKLWVPKSSPNYEALYLNLTNPILADPQVRQALALGFDPRAEITALQKGNAVATCDDNTGTPAHEPNLVQNGLCPYGPNATAKFDPTAAGQLLDSDGWTIGSDGYRHKGGQTLELRISTTSSRQDRLDSEQLIQAAWKYIGVKLLVNNFIASELYGPVLFPTDSKYAKSNNQWDVTEFENNIGLDPDTHTIWESSQTPPAGGLNLTYYNNPLVDQWEKQQLKTFDAYARNQLFHQIHAQILKDIPTIYLYSPLDLSEYRANLHNYSPDSIGPSETENIWDWWLSS